MAGYSYCSDWAVATIVHFVLLWKNSSLTWSVALIDLIPAQPSSTIATAHTHKTKRTKQTNKCCSHGYRQSNGPIYPFSLKCHFPSCAEFHFAYVYGTSDG